MPSLSHNNLIKLVRNFVPDISDYGVCNGYSSILIQSLLTQADQGKMFFQRLDNINRLYMSNNEIDLDKINNEINEILEKGKRKEILSENDLQILEIRAFCENISLHQEPQSLNSIFANKFVSQHEKNKLYALTLPNVYKSTKHYPENIFHAEEIGTVSLDNANLSKYFETIKNTLKNDNVLQDELRFILSSTDHAMVLTYLQDQDKWRLMDVNMDYENYKIHGEELGVNIDNPNYFDVDTQTLVNYLLTNYSANNRGIFSLTMVSKPPLLSLLEILKQIKNEHFTMPEDDLDKALLLVDACQLNEINLVNELLKVIIDVNQVNSIGFTALQFASQQGNLPVIKELLKKGANVNLGDQDGVTPLYRACKFGNIDVALELLNNGALVNQVSDFGTNALFIACKQGHLPIVEELIRRKVEVNQASTTGLTPLIMACKRGYLGIVQTLLKNDAVVNQVTQDGDTPLLIACENGHLAVVRELLRFKKDEQINQENNQGITPLLMACRNGHFAIVQELLSNGAAPNQMMAGGFTALMMACQTNNLPIAVELLKNRANASQATQEGISPLHIACFNGNLDLVIELLKNGADINKQTNDGLSPIEFAVINGKIDIAHELLVRGAHVNIKESESNNLVNQNIQTEIKVVVETEQNQQNESENTEKSEKRPPSLTLSQKLKREEVLKDKDKDKENLDVDFNTSQSKRIVPPAS